MLPQPLLSPQAPPAISHRLGGPEVSFQQGHAMPFTLQLFCFMGLFSVIEVCVCLPKFLLAIWLDGWACLRSFAGSGWSIARSLNNVPFQNHNVPGHNPQPRSSVALGVAWRT